MLNPNALESDIRFAMSNLLPAAIQGTIEKLRKHRTEVVNDRIQEAVDEFSTRFIGNGAGDGFPYILAQIIDTYIKSGVISGTIVTTGTPVTQQAVLIPTNLGNPTAGSVPNTLGIK